MKGDVVGAGELGLEDDADGGNAGNGDGEQGDEGVLDAGNSPFIHLRDYFGNAGIVTDQGMPS